MSVQRVCERFEGAPLASSQNFSLRHPGFFFISYFIGEFGEATILFRVGEYKIKLFSVPSFSYYFLFPLAFKI